MHGFKNLLSRFACDKRQISKEKEIIILSCTSCLAEGWADLLPLSGAERVKRRAVSDEVLVGTEVPQ